MGKGLAVNEDRTKSLAPAVSLVRSVARNVMSPYHRVEDVLKAEGSASSRLASQHSSKESRPTTCHELVPRSSKQVTQASINPTAFTFPKLIGITDAPSHFAALGPLTDLERHCFSYFNHQTTPQFLSYFESIIWRTNAVRAMHHPALFSAAVALAAVHRRFTYGISREAFEYCAHADKLYKKALLQLDIVKQRNSQSFCFDNCQIIAVVEALLAMFQAYQDESTITVQHIRSCLVHLIRGGPLRPIASERRYTTAKSHPEVFCRLFHQLYCRLTHLLNFPIKIFVKTSDRRPLPPMPSEYQSIEEARDYLFTELDWILHSQIRWQDPASRNTAHNFHVARLTQWSLAYTATVNHMSRTPRQKQACALMKLARNAAYCLSYLIFFADLAKYPVSPLPDLTDDLGCHEDPLLSHTTNALRDATLPHNLLPSSINMAHIKPTVNTLLASRTIWDPSTDTDPSQEYSLCESSEVGAYAVANKVGVMGDAILCDVIGEMVPGRKGLGWPDVTCTIQQRMVLLRYYVAVDEGWGRGVGLDGGIEVGEGDGNGDGTGAGVGGGYWWVQEWWEF